MDEKLKLKASVVTNLRAVLSSAKGSFTLKKANIDYMNLTGKFIPFKELGFRTLADFISSEPAFYTSTAPNGELMVEASREEKTEHMINLVQRAKTSKKSKKFIVRCGDTSHRRKPVNSNSWRPNKSVMMKSQTQNTYGSGRILHHTSSNYSAKQKLQQSYVPAEEHTPKSTNISPKKNEKPEMVHKNSEKKLTETSVRNKNTNASLSRNSSMNSSTFSRQSSVDSNISTGNSNEVGGSSPNERIINTMNRKSVDANDLVKDIPKEILRPEPLTGINFNEILERTYAHQKKPLMTSTSLNSTDDYDAPVFDSPETKEFVMPTSPNNSHQLRAWPESLVPWLRKPENSIVENSPVISRGRGRTIKNVVNQMATSPILSPLEYDPCNDILNKLTDLTKKLKLFEVPEVKLITRSPKYGPQLTFAQLKIGTTYNCSTWPTEFTEPESARLDVLRKAYSELSAKLLEMTSLPESDPSIMCSRLLPIIKEHPSGIWADKVEEIYKEQFREQLPSNWLPIAGKHNIIVDSAANGKFILYIDTNPDKIKQAEKPEKMARGFSIQSRLKRSPVIDQVEPAFIPEIELPADALWDVVITCATNTCNLWIRNTGSENSKYENLTVEMEKYYSEQRNHLTVQQVKKGYCFAVYENETWMRARVLEVQSSDSNNTKEEYVCLLVDHGHEYKFTVDKLHVLPAMFVCLPAQAIHCSLYGLIELVDIEYVNNIVEELIGQRLYSEVIEESESTVHGKMLNIALYDTSLTDDRCINKDIVNKVYNKAPTPTLNMKGILLSMNCAYIDENNHIYLQRSVDEQSVLLFNELMDRMAIHIEELSDIEYITDVMKLDSSVYYLAKYSDNIWYRCQIIEIIPIRNSVQVIYIDFGNTDEINLNEQGVIQLNTVSNILTDFPPQCIKAGLHHTTFKIPPDTYNTVQKILLEDNVVVVKVIMPSDKPGQLPMVELFKRSKTGSFYSLNRQLGLIKQDLKKQETNNNKSESNMSKVDNWFKHTNTSTFPSLSNFPSTGNIPKPKLPEVREMFPVRVPNASSPWNFFVQPYKNGRELKSFMEELQKFYNTDNHNKTSFQFADIKQGEIYAACHSVDSQWYRTCVNQVINNESISAYFVDFGAYVVLKSDQLLPLHDKFKQFPYQAIKARLTGVWPLNDKWTVKDCEIFQKMVVGNVFVAYLEDIGPDVFNNEDIVLSLKLIDTITSETQDFYVDKILIEKGIAMTSSSRPASISSNTDDE